jgi:hypothetical protein
VTKSCDKPECDSFSESKSSLPTQEAKATSTSEREEKALSSDCPRLTTPPTGPGALNAPALGPRSPLRSRPMGEAHSPSRSRRASTRARGQDGSQVGQEGP